MILPDYLQLFCSDNLELMSKYKNKYFNWAIVDIEYNIGASSPSVKPDFVKQKSGKSLPINSNKYKKENWDTKLSTEKYFKELFRVSKNQIIFGGNYYGLKGGYLVWDKLNGSNDQFGCELAWLSFTKRTDIIYYLWSGMMQGKYCGKDISKAIIQQGNKKLNEERIHPTQKPVLLYLWLIREYLSKGDKLLDTHLGSASIAIATDLVNYHNSLEIELIGCENNKSYFDDSILRVENHLRVQKIPYSYE